MISIQCGELRPVLSKLSSIVTHFVCFVVNVNFAACFHHLEPITIKNTCGIMHIFSDIGHNMHNLAVSFLNFKQFTIFDIDP